MAGTLTVSTTTPFKRGDKVREIKFGGTYTVLFQRGSLMVFVEELANGWIHPGNLRLVADQAEAQALDLVTPDEVEHIEIINR